MAEQTGGKLNYLERTLPEGLLVDSRWMEQHGFSTSLRSQYVAAGWLVQPARGTYKRPVGTLTWQRAVMSLQTLLARPLVVGGRTALELQGFAHYVSATGPSVIHLYGIEPPPGWLTKLPLSERFQFHRSPVLFTSDFVVQALPGLAGLPQEAEGLHVAALRQMPEYGGATLTVSTPERALLELLHELPNHESFHQVDMIVEGLRTLSPRRLQELLVACRSIKVKRLFFWLAERHGHAWLEDIERSTIDLGSGKRMLVRGGKLDPRHLITVPEDLDAPV